MCVKIRNVKFYIPTKTYDSYTWPDSVAPSKDVTPVPLTHLPVVNWRSRMDHFLAVPVRPRVGPFPAQVGNKLVAKDKFRGLTVTPLTGLSFD